MSFERKCVICGGGFDERGKHFCPERAVFISSSPPAVTISGGKKYDQEKAPMDLLPYEALEEVARVLSVGEQKYGTANWAEGIAMRRLLSAALRHIGQFNTGEDKDPETQTLHLANAACNLLFAIWMYKNRPDLDDRWSKKIKNKLTKSFPEQGT